MTNCSLRRRLLACDIHLVPLSQVCERASARARERGRESARARARERERERLGVCTLCQIERDRQRESLCMCVYAVLKGAAIHTVQGLASLGWVRFS